MRFKCLLESRTVGGEYRQRVMTKGGEVRGGDVVRGDGANLDLTEFGKLHADLEFAAV